MRSTTQSKDSPAEGFTLPIVLHTGPGTEIDDDRLLELSSLNSDLRLERDEKGDLIVMPPTGGETGNKNVEITGQLWAWSRSDGTGMSFDSSTGFRLPNGAVRAPDASWVRRERFESLTGEQRRKFPPLCPEFVIELRSPTDRLEVVREKMDEYVENGAKLGWLIDPLEQRAHIYRSGEPVEVMERPEKLSGDPMLKSFELDLRGVW